MGLTTRNLASPVYSVLWASSGHVSGSISLDKTEILSWKGRVVSQGSQGIEGKTGKEERRRKGRMEGGEKEGSSKMNSEMSQEPRDFGFWSHLSHSLTV